MKAVGYRANWPVDHAEALLDLELPVPVPGVRDVLVRVKAVSVSRFIFSLRVSKPKARPGSPAARNEKSSPIAIAGSVSQLKILR